MCGILTRVDIIAIKIHLLHFVTVHSTKTRVVVIAFSIGCWVRARILDGKTMRTAEGVRSVTENFELFKPADTIWISI